MKNVSEQISTPFNNDVNGTLIGSKWICIRNYEVPHRDIYTLKTDAKRLISICMFKYSPLFVAKSPQYLSNIHLNAIWLQSEYFQTIKLGSRKLIADEQSDRPRCR